MRYVNPLTYFSNSSIIDYNSVQSVPRNQITTENAEKEFLKLLVEKIYIKDFNRSSLIQSEDDENDELSILSNDFSNMIVNELFRQQLAEQMVEEKLIDLDLNIGGNK